MSISYREVTESFPFVRKSKRGRIESYWDVTPTGDYVRDSDTGSRFALAFMAAAHQTFAGGSTIVPIIRDMMKAENTLTPPRGMTGFNGIVEGFLCTLGHVSHAAWTPTAIVHARKWQDEHERSAEKWTAKFAAERSQRARKAALAGAAKRRKAKAKRKKSRRRS